MFKGAIFDVDGTILDSMAVWENMTSRFLGRYGVEMTAEMAARFKDMTLEESLPLIISEFGIDMDEKSIFEEFNRMACEEYIKNVPAKPGAAEYIKRIAEHGVKIAIATSGFPEACRGAFERLGIAKYISAYAFSSEVGVDKTNPDIYLLAAKRIGIKIEDCMVFEDIYAGVCGAKRAGAMTTAVFDRSSAAETEQLKKSADRYISEWSELDDFAG